MRKFTFIEPDESGNPVQHEMTEKEVLDYYFEYWSGQMKKVGKEDMISEERCIEDFCVVHWASEI